MHTAMITMTTTLDCQLWWQSAQCIYTVKARTSTSNTCGRWRKLGAKRGVMNKWYNIIVVNTFDISFVVWYTYLYTKVWVLEVYKFMTFIIPHLATSLQFYVSRQRRYLETPRWIKEAAKDIQWTWMSRACVDCQLMVIRALNYPLLSSTK